MRANKFRKAKTIMKPIRKLTRAVTLSVAVLTVLTLCILAVSAAGGDTTAAGTEAAETAAQTSGLYFLSIALCLLPAAACGVVEGLATGKAVESISRNPESASKVQSLLILGLALTESSSIYGFAVALILIFLK